MWTRDIYIYIIGLPVYQCGEHWSGGPGSLVRGAKEKLSVPPIGCPQNLSAKSVHKILCAISDKTGEFVFWVRLLVRLSENTCAIYVTGFTN